MSQSALLCSNCGNTTRDGKKALMVCGSCRNAQYCNVKCQKQHWKQGGHKMMCKKLVAGLLESSHGSSFQYADGADAAIDCPVEIFGGMTKETLTPFMDIMHKDSKKLRRKYDRKDTEACWDAAEANHALVLGYITDKQWSMASTYIIEWHAAFLDFQKSFPAGTSYAMAHDEAGTNKTWPYVQSHVDSIQQSGTLVNQMLLRNTNECTRLQVIQMPLGRARTDAVYEIVDDLISEQGGWATMIAKMTDKKLNFMVWFDRECISLLMGMGMVSRNGVDVHNNFNVILVRTAHAIQLLENYQCVPAGVLPYKDYLEDLAYFRAQQAKIAYLKPAMFGT